MEAVINVNGSIAEEMLPIIGKLKEGGALYHAEEGTSLFSPCEHVRLLRESNGWFICNRPWMDWLNL